MKLRPMIERFWEHVQKRGPDECWEWTSPRMRGGYGWMNRAGRGSKKERANRLSWEINVGPIPDGMFVCHRCDNPPCVNPRHLFLGTCADNNRDMFAKGRYSRRSQRGIDNGNAKLGAAECQMILALTKLGSRVNCLAEWFGVDRTTIDRVRARYRAQDAVDQLRRMAG